MSKSRTGSSNPVISKRMGRICSKESAAAIPARNGNNNLISGIGLQGFKDDLFPLIGKRAKR
jgi:hypothetical protein